MPTSPGSDSGFDAPRPQPTQLETTVQTLVSGITERKIFPGMQEDDIADLITIASRSLSSGPLGRDGTDGIRMLIAAGIAGSRNPNVIRGLSAGVTEVDFNTVSTPDRIKHIIETASESLIDSPLGVEGVKDMRVLLAASVSGSENQNVLNGLTGSTTSMKLSRLSDEDTLAHVIRTASHNLSSGPLGQEGTDNLKALIAISAVATK